MTFFHYNKIYTVRNDFIEYERMGADMTILMWISRWQNEMELMIMGLQIILFLFLTIGVFCIVRQQKKANRCRRRLELYLKKHMDKPKKKEEKSVSPENVQNKNLHEDEEENRIISTVLQEIFP